MTIVEQIEQRIHDAEYALLNYVPDNDREYDIDWSEYTYPTYDQYFGKDRAS